MWVRLAYNAAPHHGQHPADRVLWALLEDSRSVLHDETLFATYGRDAMQFGRHMVSAAPWRGCVPR